MIESTYPWRNEAPPPSTTGWANMTVNNITYGSAWTCLWLCSAEPAVNFLIVAFETFPQAHFTWWGYYVKDLNKPVYSVLVSVYVFVALSTVFYSMNSPKNSLLSRFVHPVLILSYWPFPLNTSLYKSLPQPRYNPLWLTGLQGTN